MEFMYWGGREGKKQQTEKINKWCSILKGVGAMEQEKTKGKRA